MKTNLIYCLLIAFIIGGCTQPKRTKIEGAWKQIEHQTITGNKAVIDFPGKSDVDVTKIWSGNHFMFVARVKMDTTVTDNYGVGTYKLDGNKYEEHISVIGYKPWEGATIKMTLVIRNDTLIQTYPVDEKGEIDKEWANIEKYVRF